MDVPFTAASHHQVLVLLVQCAALLFTARVLGDLAQRLRQPSVVGELLAGILLGPSLLGAVPGLGAWLVPHEPVQGYLLETVSLLGAMFLLLITGLETDLRLIVRHARTAIGVSFGGIVVTFATGFALGWNLPADMRGAVADPLVFALFVATSMSISAIPVIGKVLMDLGMMRRDVGQTILAAGMSDDTVGWVLLSVVVALASGTGLTAMGVFGIVLKVLLFMAFSFTLGQAIIGRMLALAQDRGIVRDRILSLVVVAMMAWAAFTQALGLEAVLGAFVMGILIGRIRRLPAEVVHQLESLTLGVFAPIFFATAGLKVSLPSLLEPRLLGIAALVIGTATVGKVVGTYLGARLIGGRPHYTALAYGAALNARGAMEIIIATIGLRLGILSVAMFSVVVVMAVTTSLMAPTALRWILRRLEVDPAEADRLKREALDAASVFAGLSRALVPVRVRTDGQVATLQFESWILGRIDPGLVVSLVSCVPDVERRPEAQAFLAASRPAFPGGEVVTKVLIDEDPARAVLEEAGRGHQLLLLGATESSGKPGVVFSPVMDAVVKASPCATLIVAGTHLDAHFPPKRILVATSGSATSRHAAELAFRLAGRGDEALEVTALHVVERVDAYLPSSDDEIHLRQMAAADQDVANLRALAESLGILVDTLVRSSASVEQEIVTVARRLRVDLLLIGTHVNVGTDELYLGPRVERILRDAPCPVILVNTA